MKTLLLFSICLLTFAGISVAQNQSVYTSTKTSACRTIRSNPNEGGSDMIYYETQSGGAVFGVGSITYPACLLVDDTISQITHNVISRFTS